MFLDGVCAAWLSAALPSTSGVFKRCLWVCAGLAEQAGRLQHAPAAGEQGVWEREEGLPAEEERRVRDENLLGASMLRPEWGIMAPSLFSQAEEGVAEEAVLSEGGHAHHLSCHSE